MNRRSISGLAVPMILLVLALAVTSLPAAAVAQVSIGDASADQGAKTITDISITQLTATLGAATIVLEYDADVEVVSVTPGTMGDFAATPAIDNANHKTTITWYKATGVTGDLTFAQVELEAIGATGETSPLDLTITTFDSTVGAAIGVNDDDGTFTVSGVSQDAIVSIGDASADQGAKTITDISITQLTATLGAATIVLEYDADVEVVSVTPGTMGDFAATPAIDNANHKTTITWYKATGVTGDLTFAQVELEAIGATGETSPLDLTITTFDSTVGAAIGVNDDDGTFTVEVPNDPPTVTVTAPVSGTVSGTIDVTATATDSDGSVTQVTFYLMPAETLIDTDADSTGGWSVSLDTTAAADGTGYQIKAVATDNEGATGENTGSVFAIDNSCPCDFCLELEAGLNFVSIPKTLDDPKNATTLFEINPFIGEVCWYYDAATGTFDDNADVKPCRGYLVRKNASMTVCENFDDGAATPSQQLYIGWNMIGAVSMGTMLIHGADDTDFASVTGLEKPEGNKLFIQMNTYVPGTGWINYPTGPLTEVTPGMGYTIVMTVDAMMYGIP